MPFGNPRFAAKKVLNRNDIVLSLLLPLFSDTKIRQKTRYELSLELTLTFGHYGPMLDDVKYPEPDPNKRPAKQVWDERYSGEGFLYGKEPLPFLKHYVDKLKKGKVMDVAMGEGQNLTFLANQGFQASGLDCSAKAIEKAKQLASEKNVEIEAKTQNLDFYLMPLMGFDSVVMTYFRPQPRFFSEIRRGLVQGGTFILEAYTVEHLRKHKDPPNIDFEDCYKPNEVIHLLKNFHILYYKEMNEGDRYIVQALAQKTSV